MELWNYFFSKLINYRKVYKNCDVPVNWATDQPFADWVHQMRKSKSKLNKPFRDKLIEINFNFDYKYFDWLEYYKQLKEFKQKHLHLHIHGTISKYKSLYDWVSRQRYRKGKLNKQQIRLLDSLGFTWDYQKVRETQWMENFNKLQAYKRRFGDANAPFLHKKDRPLATWLHSQRELQQVKKLPLERVQMLESIGLKWNGEHNGRKNLTDKIWKSRLKKLSDYKVKYGHTNVPSSWKEDRLFSRWISELRLEYKKGLLPKEKIESLNELDFEWEPINAKEWELMLVELKNFRERYNHLEVPSDKAAYLYLYQWMSYIRTKIRTIESSRRKELSDIGFEWKPIDENWIQRFEELKNFKETYGHTRILLRNEYKQLHGWVVHLRNRTSTLSERKIKLLDSIGFEWVITGKTHEVKWSVNYDMLKAYKLRFGNCRVSEGWMENPSLVNWVQTQRDEEETLSPDRLEKLQQLDFTWTKDIDAEKESRWNEMYERLKVHHNSVGNFIIPKDSKDGHSLGIWISNQRANYRKGLLSKERILKLDALSFVWEGKDQVKLRHATLWEENFHKLQLFYQKHEHCKVSSKEDTSLNAWVVAQRMAEKNLSENQKKMLTDIEFAWAVDKKNELDNAWISKFNELIAFKQQYGHCTVSLNTKGFIHLGMWAQKQRSREKKGTLPLERKNKLEKLGFVFSNGVSERLVLLWNEKMEALKVFKKQFGHVRVPAKWKENPSLGTWLDNIKRRYDAVSDEKKEELKELGFSFGN